MNLDNFLQNFHFESPQYLWGVLILPLIAFIYGVFYKNHHYHQQLEKFIDKDLLPHLLRKSDNENISVFKSFFLTSIIWLLLMLAMAGPRWDFQKVQLLSDDKSLLILLDLSNSMGLDDVTPSRVKKARFLIEDIIDKSEDTKIGLIAFATDAHLLSPITSDKKNILRLLPYIDIDLVDERLRGTFLTPALKKADLMLGNEISKNKSVLIISDGGFQDSDFLNVVSSMSKKNIMVHCLGIGKKGKVHKYDTNGNLANISLQEDVLKKISSYGSGVYFNFDHDEFIIKLMNFVNNGLSLSGAKQEDQKIWDEKFYLFVIPIILMILPWFRRGFVFSLIALSLLISSANGAALNNKNSNTNEIIDKIILNKEQYAKKKLEEADDADAALTVFDDPYKRGVAYYKSGDFKKAEKEFRKNKRPEVEINSLYNLGNSLAKQQKYQESIDVYNDLLDKVPTHSKAQHNLEVVKNLMSRHEQLVEKERKKRPPEDGDNKMPSGGGGGGGDDQDQEDQDDNKDQDDQNNNDDQDNDDQNDNKDENDQEDQGDNNDQDKENNQNDQNNNDNQDNNDQEDQNDNKQDDNKEQNNGQDIDKQAGQANGDLGDFDDKDFDQIYNSISNDYKNFLKNQFLMESIRNKTKIQKVLW